MLSGFFYNKNHPAPSNETRPNEKLNPDFEPPSQYPPANVQQERF